jgi:hypothetical protein
MAGDLIGIKRQARPRTNVTRGTKTMKLAVALAAMLMARIPTPGQDNPFQNTSERAGVVLITALLAAQQHGAASVDVNDLIVGLIAEDQDPRAPVLFMKDTPLEQLFSPKRQFSQEPGEKGREPFFPPKVAVDILTKLNQILPQSSSLPPGTEMPTSAAYDRALTAANKLPSQLHQGEVQIRSGTDMRPPGMYQAIVPLDLLAAILREPCEGTRMLQAAGITEEKVPQILRTEGADLENGNFRLDPGSGEEKTP